MLQTGINIGAMTAIKASADRMERKVRHPIFSRRVRIKAGYLFKLHKYR